MLTALGSSISESALNGIKTMKSALTANGGVTSENIFPSNATKGLLTHLFLNATI